MGGATDFLEDRSRSRVEISSEDSARDCGTTSLPTTKTHRHRGGLVLWGTNPCLYRRPKGSPRSEFCKFWSFCRSPFFPERHKVFTLRSVAHPRQAPHRRRLGTPWALRGQYPQSH